MNVCVSVIAVVDIVKYSNSVVVRVVQIAVASCGEIVILRKDFAKVSDAPPNVKLNAELTLIISSLLFGTPIIASAGAEARWKNAILVIPVYPVVNELIT